MLAAIVYILMMVLGLGVYLVQFDRYGWVKSETDEDDYPLTTAFVSTLIGVGVACWTISSVNPANWLALLIVAATVYGIFTTWYNAIRYYGRHTLSPIGFVFNLAYAIVVTGGLIYYLAH